MGQPRTDWADLGFPHPLEAYSPLIVNVALTGVIPTRETTPYVPLSPEEIVADAVRCHDVGAAVVHVHARDPDGQPTYKGDIFAEIISGIRKERPQLIVCATTSGRRCGDLDQRSTVLDLDGEAKPDLASLTTGSINFNDSPSVNSPDVIWALAERMLARGIKPELEILELGMINTAKLLIKDGLAQRPYYFNILLGSMHAMAATALNLSAAVAGLPRGSVWSGTGLGRFQVPVNILSIAMGGHVRTGVEDNLYYDFERTRLTSNEQAVRRLVRIAAEAGRPVANADEARSLLGLPLRAADAGGVRIEKARKDDMALLLCGAGRRSHGRDVRLQAPVRDCGQDHAHGSRPGLSALRLGRAASGRAAARHGRTRREDGRDERGSPRHHRLVQEALRLPTDRHGPQGP